MATIGDEMMASETTTVTCEWRPHAAAGGTGAWVSTHPALSGRLLDRNSAVTAIMLAEAEAAGQGSSPQSPHRQRRRSRSRPGTRPRVPRLAVPAARTAGREPDVNVTTAVAEALNAAEDVTAVQRDTVVIHLRLADFNGPRNALDRIGQAAAVMTAAGVPYPAQVTVLRDGLGVILGTGRTGRVNRARRAGTAVPGTAAGTLPYAPSGTGARHDDGLAAAL